jgi:GT2 family glycosyltransferase
VREKGISYFDHTKAEEVDWVIGAYFMIRKSVMDNIGLLDEQFWLYGEETDFCRRAKTAGFETWYYPDAVVVHHWGGMTAYNVRVIVWLHLGVKLYADKHFHGARKFLIIYLRYFGAAVRVIVYPVVACITFNKQLFVKAYYYGVALFKLLTERWRYDHNHVGEVIPWTKYL